MIERLKELQQELHVLNALKGPLTPQDKERADQIAFEGLTIIMLIISRKDNPLSGKTMKELQDQYLQLKAKVGKSTPTLEDLLFMKTLAQETERRVELLRMTMPRPFQQN